MRRSLCSAIAVLFLGQAPSANAAESIAQLLPDEARWLEGSDLPAKTRFFIRQDGSFDSCVPPSNKRDTSVFRAACDAFISDNAKARLARPLGDPGSWISPADYPHSARASHASGTSHVELMVSATGKVTSCKIVESSGFSDLDEATCNLLLARGQFIPARDKAGNAISQSFREDLRWAQP